MTQQWLNPSGEIKNLHIVANKNVGQPNTWQFNDMNFGFPIYDNPGAKVFDENLYNKLKPIFHSNETQKLLDEWMQTGEIPDALQDVLLMGVAHDPRMD